MIKNPLDGLPVALGDFTTFPVMMSLVGLAVIIGLEKLKVPGGILLTIIGISIVGLIFDPNVHFSGVFAMPSLSDENGNSLIGSLDIMGALNPVVLPSVLALVMTAVFDATGTIRAVAGQANLLDKDGQIIDGGKALTTDSMSSVFSGLVGAARQRYTSSLRRVRRRAVNRFDGYHRWRAVPADSVPLSALLPRSGVRNGSGADVRWPADAEQRGENRLC